MKIRSIKTYYHAFELTRPYKVAYKTQTTAENVIVEIIADNGIVGLGAGSPAAEVTQETMDVCLNQLTQEALAWLINRDLADIEQLKPEVLRQLGHSPAACAAVDIALHDLYAQMQNKPLVEVLGRVHQQLPTSITIGIKNIKDTMIEAAEYVERGFSVLKVKLGCDVEEDVERVIKLREHYGSSITIRVDPNQGYHLSDLINFIARTKHVDIEFIEQPLKANAVQDLHELKDEHKKMIALDESILNAQDAMKAIAPIPSCGIFNIKLMKCGGIYGALKIAAVAKKANIDLMWGCMDESIISISAALHVAFSSRQTRYLDLDGSLDLANDIVTGGFHLKNGLMSPLDLPGLGLKKI